MHNIPCFLYHSLFVLLCVIWNNRTYGMENMDSVVYLKTSNANGMDQNPERYRSAYDATLSKDGNSLFIPIEKMPAQFYYFSLQNVKNASITFSNTHAQVTISAFAALFTQMRFLTRSNRTKIAFNDDPNALDIRKSLALLKDDITDSEIKSILASPLLAATRSYLFSNQFVVMKFSKRMITSTQHDIFVSFLAHTIGYLYKTDQYCIKSMQQAEELEKECTIFTDHILAVVENDLIWIEKQKKILTSCNLKDIEKEKTAFLDELFSLEVLLCNKKKILGGRKNRELEIGTINLSEEKIAQQMHKTLRAKKNYHAMNYFHEEVARIEVDLDFLTKISSTLSLSKGSQNIVSLLDISKKSLETAKNFMNHEDKNDQCIEEDIKKLLNDAQTNYTFANKMTIKEITAQQVDLIKPISTKKSDSLVENRYFSFSHTQTFIAGGIFVSIVWYLCIKQSHNV